MQIKESSFTAEYKMFGWDVKCIDYTGSCVVSHKEVGSFGGLERIEFSRKEWKRGFKFSSQKIKEPELSSCNIFISTTHNY